MREWSSRTGHPQAGSLRDHRLNRIEAAVVGCRGESQYVGDEIVDMDVLKRRDHGAPGKSGTPGEKERPHRGEIGRVAVHSTGTGSAASGRGDPAFIGNRDDRLDPGMRSIMKGSGDLGFPVDLEMGCPAEPGNDLVAPAVLGG